MGAKVKARGPSWQATVTHHGKRYRKQFPTQLEAEFWAKGMEAQLSAGDMNPLEPVDHRPTTLRELLAEVWDNHWKDSKSARKVEVNIQLVLKAMGAELSLSRLNQRQIDMVIDTWKQQGASNGTINRRLAVVSYALKWAEEREYITRSPRIRRLREPKHRTRYISQAEEKAMFKYLKTIEREDMVDYVTVALDTGMRVGEVLILRGDNILFDEGVILLHEGTTKNDEARTIPMTDRVADIMQRRVSGNEIVFPELSRSVIRHQWDRMRQELGLSEDAQFVPHAMRHTFCSRLVQRNVDLSVVKQLAGHKTLAVTLRYAHLNTANLKEAVQQLNG